MAQPTANQNPLTSQALRTAAALSAVFLLLYFAGAHDFLSNLTRPVVVGLLKLVGVTARDASGALVLGRLHVPWTRDCAGVNILAMLWAVTLWGNRAEPFSRRYWLRLLLSLPAALAANIGRIFVILAYRRAFWPAIESPQLHYLFGFLSVAPFVPLLVPRAGRAPGAYLLETLYLVAALASVAPFVHAPGGALVAIATLLLVAQSAYTPNGPGRSWSGALWLLAALAIASASMESLWLPWLMLCPWFARLNLRRAPHRLALVLGTVPLVAMHPLGRWLVGAAAAMELWQMSRDNWVPPERASSGSSLPAWTRVCLQSGLGLLLVLPFVASSISGLVRPSLRPPLGVMARSLGDNTYQLKLINQPADLDLLWYGPSGDGRHHTLPVCMRYRGIELKPAPAEPAVMTDGQHWMREFFLHGGDLLPDYRSYLLRTLWPWSPAGVHLIAVGPANRMPAKAFDDRSKALAEQVHSLGDPIPSPGSFRRR